MLTAGRTSGACVIVRVWTVAVALVVMIRLTRSDSVVMTKRMVASVRQYLSAGKRLIWGSWMGERQTRPMVRACSWTVR